MKKRHFLIQSLAAAGLAMPAAAAPTSIDRETSLKNSTGLFTVFATQKEVKTAQHRSHQSHSSHRSSSGGSRSYSKPAPKPTPTPRRSDSTPPSSILPQNSLAPSSGLSPAEQFTERAKRVQSGLKAYGYYNGSIDGVVGADTKTALSKYQKDFDLKVTGTITPEVLTSFGIT